MAWAVLLGGLRHYLVRTAPMHERLWHGIRGVCRIDVRSVPWIDAVRRASSRRAAGLHAQRGWLGAMHVVGLWSVAVVQPLFDVLGRGPEFFVAHDTGPGELIGLVLVLGLAGPAGCLIVMRSFRLLGPGWHMLATGGVIGGLVAAVALQTAGRTAGLGAPKRPCPLPRSFGCAREQRGLPRLVPTTGSASSPRFPPAALVIPAAFLLQTGDRGAVSVPANNPPQDGDPSRRGRLRATSRRSCPRVSEALA